MTTTMRVWDPMRDFVTLREAMDRLVEESVVRTPRAEGGRNGQYRPAADAWETADALVIELSLPGIDPQDVEVTYEQDQLTISGKRPEPAEERTWILRESARGAFERRFTLTSPIDADGVEAHFHNGILTLHLPKSEATRPRKIDVRAN